MNVLFNFAVKLLGFFIIIMPYRIQLWFGDLLGYLWFDVIRLRRNVALNNLKMAFPEKSKADHIRIARASCCNSGRTFIEILRMPFLNWFDYTNDFEIIGREHLDQALKANRGVCLLSLHLSNGDWGIAGFALHKIPLSVITKEFKIKIFNDFWFRIREVVGTQFIKDRASSIQILKTLKKNGIIVFVLDQFMGPPIGVKTTFFGHETGTAMGLAVIVNRSRSPVLLSYCVRLPSGKTQIIIEPEIPFVESSNSEETIQKMTQTYNDHIEKVVSKYPELWMWVHRRWKVYKY
jgi:KDO2-lipid IV(A) lauroyltransferase